MNKLYKISLGGLLFLFLCIILNPFLITSYAENGLEIFSTFGLYCQYNEAIKAGKISFDLTDNELFSQSKAKVEAEYNLTNLNQTVDFALPFLSNVIDMPLIDVFVNGQKAHGEIYYGHYSYSYYSKNNIEKAVNDTYSGVLDENISGTLYTVFPDNEEIDVSITLSENQSLIYETSNSLSSSGNANELHLILRNALSIPEYTFFVIGGQLKDSLKTTCEYKKEIITCKEYIDMYYTQFQEFYEINGNPPREFFYSQINALLEKKDLCRFNEFFFDLPAQYSINIFKFSAPVYAETTISCITQTRFQQTGNYSPAVYELNHVCTGSYPIDYRIQLNETKPYIIGSTSPLEFNGTSYTASLNNEDFYCAFCSSNNPINTAEQNRNNLARQDRIRKIILTVCTVVACIAIIVIVISIELSFRNKRN